MAIRDFRNLRVIVTGSSQGIGRAIVVQAAKAGAKVVAAARSAELLNELKTELAAAGFEITTVVCDINSEIDRAKLLNSTKEVYGGLDVLINNAGIGATGHFMDSDPNALRQIFETNFFALAELTRSAIPLLQTGITPLIINISSVLGRRAIPGRSLYSASKFALAGFSEALRAEIDPLGIHLLVVNPGLTQTNFSKNMLEQKAKVQLDHLRGMTSEEVAEATLRAACRGKNEITLTRNGKLLVLISRLAPMIIERITKRRVRRLFAEEIAERKAKHLGTTGS
ncbi:MAG: SDR family NAD(P)-dependent oxidoreductase [Gemmataceae bacterium]